MRAERRADFPPLLPTQPASCWLQASPMGQVEDPRGWQVPLLPALEGKPLGSQRELWSLDPCVS